MQPNTQNNQADDCITEQLTFFIEIFQFKNL